MKVKKIDTKPDAAYLMERSIQQDELILSAMYEAFSAYVTARKELREANRQHLGCRGMYLSWFNRRRANLRAYADLASRYFREQRLRQKYEKEAS